MMRIVVLSAVAVVFVIGVIGIVFGIIDLRSDRTGLSRRTIVTFDAGKAQATVVVAYGHGLGARVTLGRCLTNQLMPRCYPRSGDEQLAQGVKGPRNEGTDPS